MSLSGRSTRVIRNTRTNAKSCGRIRSASMSSSTMKSNRFHQSKMYISHPCAMTLSRASAAKNAKKKWLALAKTVLGEQ